jgi:hypothetical protein
MHQGKILLREFYDKTELQARDKCLIAVQLPFGLVGFAKASENRVFQFTLSWRYTPI